MKKYYLYLILLLFPVQHQLWAQERDTDYHSNVESTAAQKDSSSYFISLESGKKIYAKSVVCKTPAFGKRYFLLDGKDRYEYDQVAFYQNEQGYFMKADPAGFGPSFYFREVDGPRIKAYSVTRTYYSPGSPTMPGGGVHTSVADYYQKDNGPLQSMNLKSLTYDLQDNRFSAAKLKEVKNLNTASAILFAAGAALVIAGIANTFNNTDTSGSPDQSTGLDLSPVLIVGAITVNIPWLLKGTKRKKMHEAVELYNKN